MIQRRVLHKKSKLPSEILVSFPRMLSRRVGSCSHQIQSFHGKSVLPLASCSVIGSYQQSKLGHTQIVPIRSISMSVITEAPKASSSSSQPEWIKPINQEADPVLRVYNSLTRNKVCKWSIRSAHVETKGSEC